MNEQVSAERLHIGFFGMRNAGKSSLVNKVTNQTLSVVSDVKGTTTDPVKKAMELLPLGPVVVIDTPGLDDEGELGALRVQRAKEVMNIIDLAVLVVDGEKGLSDLDRELLLKLKERKIPTITAYNKSDLLNEHPAAGEHEIYVSAETGENVEELKEMLGKLSKGRKEERLILSGLVSAGDTVVLVIPIDESAPKGRLILPQQQTLREALDIHASVAVCQVEELSHTLASLRTPPKLVITDSQAFGAVSKIVPEDVVLTSFSILFARYKGELSELVKGAARLSHLEDGDKVLISEGCTHHRQCNDIGTVKLPGWIREYTSKNIDFSFTSGGEFPEDLKDYSLIVHCGGCMLNETAMKHRLASAKEAGVPMVNYGVAIAQMHGILKRSLAPFPEAMAILEA